MEVQQITMDPIRARQAFEAYRQAVRKKYNADFDALAKGYKAIAEGHAVIDLHGVLKSTGVDQRLRPKMAIARADWEWAHFSRQWIHGRWSYAFSKDSSFSDRQWRCYTTIPESCFPENVWNANVRCKARVPMVPAMYLPRRGSLGNYHLLWEADWEDVPVDPILLKHLSGALYAVLAQWDLTPLEQAVMRK